MNAVSFVVFALGWLLVLRVLIFRPDPPDMPAIRVWCVVAGAVLSVGLILCGRRGVLPLPKVCHSLPRILGVGILAWFFLSAGLYGWHVWNQHARSTIALNAATQASREYLTAAIEDFRSANGRYPTRAEGFLILVKSGIIKGGIPCDPWGTQFQYDLVDGKPVVISAGRDREFGTKDDIK